VTIGKLEKALGATERVNAGVPDFVREGDAMRPVLRDRRQSLDRCGALAT
jgi:hypothetical protein